MRRIFGLDVSVFQDLRFSGLDGPDDLWGKSKEVEKCELAREIAGDGDSCPV